MDKRVWVCPGLCGCQLLINANWANDDNPSYYHPIPGTLTSVSIDTVCNDHESLLKTQPEDDTMGGQIAGYLKRAPNTDAERLYVGLYGYRGQVWTPDTCDCRIYEVHNRQFDPANSLVARQFHPKHTHKCSEHINDDDAHTAAVENCVRKNIVISKLQERGLDENSITWSFDPERVLRVSTLGRSSQQKSADQSILDSIVGPNTVVIE